MGLPLEKIDEWANMSTNVQMVTSEKSDTKIVITSASPILDKSRFREIFEQYMSEPQVVPLRAEPELEWLKGGLNKFEINVKEEEK